MCKKEIFNKILDEVDSKYFLLGVCSLISVILFFIVSPLILIWSINTLFNSILTIEYSVSTYFAMLFLNFILLGSIKRNLSNIANSLK